MKSSMKTKQCVKYIFLLFVTLHVGVMTDHIHAQSHPPDSVKLKAIATSDGSIIKIRWAPLDYESWQYGLDSGYRIERFSLKRFGDTLSLSDRIASHVILDSLIFPISENEWEPLADNDDKAGVVAGAIYGEDFEVDSLDGSNILKAYSLTVEKENRYNYCMFGADQDFDIALNAGMGFIDSSTVIGYTYMYLISANGSNILLPWCRALVVIERDSINTLPQIPSINHISGDSTTQIFWNKKLVTEFFTSYVVERSDDGGASFSVRNSLPLVHTSQSNFAKGVAVFVDSLPSNDITYVYQVRGRSPFGELGPPSDTIHIKGKPGPLNVFPHIIDVLENVPGELDVTWNFPDSNEVDILGFNIYRSETRHGQFELLNQNFIHAQKRNYKDRTILPSNYYVVEAVDINDHSMKSLAELGQLNDTIPPAAPINITHEILESGQIKLSWSKNTEDDLRGYRVFTANHPDAEFSQLTKVCKS